MVIPEGRWRFGTAEVGHVQGHEADATNEALISHMLMYLNGRYSDYDQP